MSSANNYFNRTDRVNNRAETERYLEKFRDPERHRLRGERTPNYFRHSTGGKFAPRQPDTASHIRDAADPECIVLISLRDPVTRAISAYWHHFAQGKLPATTSIFQAPKELGLIDMGFYKKHFEDWIGKLGEERVRVIFYDDLVAEPAKYLRSALRALGADTDTRHWDTVDLKARINHRQWLRPIRAANSTLSPQELAALVELYEDDISYVESLTGRDLSHWRNINALIDKNIPKKKS